MRKQRNKVNTEKECSVHSVNLPFTVLLTRIGLPRSRKINDVRKLEKRTVRLVLIKHKVMKWKSRVSQLYHKVQPRHVICC